MKKLFSVLLVAFLFSALGNYSYANYTLSGTGAPTVHATLQAALTAANSATNGTGAKTITVNGPKIEALGSTLVYDKAAPKWTSLLITSSVVGSTIECTANAPVITLDNAVFVTIDGTSGGGTLTLNSTFLPAGTLKGSINFSNGSSGNLIRNITCNSNDNNGRMINIAQTTTAGKGNNGNIVEFVTIDGGARGFQDFGTAGIASNNGNTLRNSKVRNSTAIGIFLGSVVNGFNCDANEVFFTNPALTLGASFTGIQVQSAGTINIRKNRIYDFQIPTGAATNHRGMISLPADFGGLPIPPTTTVNIINNFVSLSPANLTGVLVLGIQTQFSAAATSVSYTANVRNNTAFIGGTSASTVGALTEAILGNRVTPAGTQTYFHNLSNNIAINKREGGDSTTFHVGLDLQPPPSPGLTVDSDYNMAWASNVSNPTRSFAASYDFVYTNAELADYKYATANPVFPSTPIELHSIFKDAPLVAGTTIGALDPSLIGGDMCGEPKVAVTDDIINTPRNALYPYKGCWEGPALKILSLTVCLEGKVAGEVKVSLYNAACVLIADGTADIGLASKTNICFGNKVADGVAYRLKVNSINHIETWSALPNIFFAAGSPPNATYNFTTSVGQAFGTNAQTVGPPICLYGGDVNQDGIVDLADNELIDDSTTLFAEGLRDPTDINSDGITDLADGAIGDENASNFVLAQSPCPGPASIISSQTRKAKKLETLYKSNAILIEAQ